jgi:leader peptidase (prepilin peptidase)/N-methyltransferase
MDRQALAAYAVYVLIFAFGLSVGSFLNVVIYRLPRAGLGLAQPRRSFCPVCRSPIRWFDNLPVFSWLLLRGRCRDCGEPIAARYPLVELAAGLLVLLLFRRYGFSPIFFFYFYFAMCLLAIALIDLELMVIPMALVYPAAALGLVCALVEPSPSLSGAWLWNLAAPTLGDRAASLAGALAGLASGWAVLKLVSAGYLAVRGHAGMGDGDPPLLGMIGAFLGWGAVPLVVLWSTLIGLFSALILMALSRGKPRRESWGQKALPFGPFLVLAAFIYLFFGQSFLAWYWAMFLL